MTTTKSWQELVAESKATAGPIKEEPLHWEKDAKGFVKLVWTAVLPHPSGQKVPQRFEKIVGNPGADPMQYYNDPLGLAVYNLLLEHEALKARIAELEKQAKPAKKNG